MSMKRRYRRVTDENFPDWHEEPRACRLRACITALVIHGIITERERDRAVDRLNKSIQREMKASEA